MSNKKVMIVAAVNGGMQKNGREGAHVPMTPAEIAEDAYRVWQAGASVVHFHARDAEGKNSGDKKLYTETIERIRDKCDVLIQTTNGIGVRYDKKSGGLIWPNDEERLGILDLDPKQDLFGIAASSGDFYNPEGGYLVETPYVNSRELVMQTVKYVLSIGANVEFEVGHVAALHRIKRMAEEGVFDANSSKVWILLGAGFAGPVLSELLFLNMNERKKLFPNAVWGTTGTGRNQFKVCNLGLSMDCDHVRVGFEDNIYLPSGEAAQRNDQLVDAIVKLAAVWGREPATPAEARQLLQI